MAYKYKPNKGMKKRLRVSGTGKVKHNHSFTSHLRSSRSSKRIRKLRRASVLFEGHARNMREFMGMKGIRPNQIAADRELAERARTAEGAEAKADKSDTSDKARPAGRSRAKRTAAAASK